MNSSYRIAPGALTALRGLFDVTPGLERVWIFGSRARGDARPESDIDLALDAPGWSAADFARLTGRIESLGLLYRVDAAWLQGGLGEAFRAAIEREKRLFWEARRHPADAAALGAISLKPFQSDVLEAVGRYLDELERQRSKSETAAEALRGAGLEVPPEMLDFPAKAWDALRAAKQLPSAFAAHAYSSRFDGAGRPIPNFCLKLPTGGGKTLLAAASVARVFSKYLRRHTGLVLWVVPNDAIYRQTFAALSDRDHPYRQILNVAAAGRVKILEKSSPLTRLDVESHLCVMVLMLQSAARRSKETLRFFRDRGNVLGFLPREDDVDAHWELLEKVPNLDIYAPWGLSEQSARRQKGSIVKSSLGNVMRQLRPMVVIDEGHHAYTETALRTLDGFNPCLMLELSATPRVGSKKTSGSNILVDVRGAALDEAEMIKLPIHVEIRRWADWQSCLAAAVKQLDELHREAEELRADTARYIRPILLVQVERTGKELRDAGFIHADDARSYLLQLGLSERQIAIKTSEEDDLRQPENIDLLSPTCEIRAIVTKQALQEGWDCPFAYVLCALAAGRSPAAMTQLVGRILRQPDVTKTGRPALDACYVLCHEAQTAEVVRAVKHSLESEGMGDLTLTVHSDDSERGGVRIVESRRRPQFARLRLFVPRVTWVEAAGTRRELVYDSDILAYVDWQELDCSALAREWAPDASGPEGASLSVGLGILENRWATDSLRPTSADRHVDRARLVRSLIDLAPNAWCVWEWIDAVVQRLISEGFDESLLAGSGASLVERLRVDIERERDRLAQTVFDQLVSEGRIEFRLRADAVDYELPTEVTVELDGEPRPLIRPDALPVQKSLLEPALRTPDMNDFEAEFAGYIDQKAALRWWHRNVAKTQLGLQGWRRHKVYPDFVFGCVSTNGQSRTVLLETKGLHLAGSQDTEYKRALFDRLSRAFQDERGRSVGELVLESGSEEVVVCEILLDEAWQGRLEQRCFGPGE